MRINRWAAGALVVACFVVMGCFYKAPKVDQKYDKISVGMTKAEVVKALGEPSVVHENEMFYIYDDPKNPVRFRFVLNEQDVVVAKHFESKAELANKTAETKGQVPAGQTTAPPPTGEPKYPGGPLKRFEKTPGAQ
jgi:outer membrane protein assembly factor BamE (lipoprotein component of BamABCDE complex)